jgi:hypothetical protein
VFQELGDMVSATFDEMVVPPPALAPTHDFTAPLPSCPREQAAAITSSVRGAEDGARSFPPLAIRMCRCLPQGLLA